MFLKIHTVIISLFLWNGYFLCISSLTDLFLRINFFFFLIKSTVWLVFHSLTLAFTPSIFLLSLLLFVFQPGVIYFSSVQFSSVQFSRSVMSDSLRPLESQHARSPCPLPSPGVHSDLCPSSQWCHPAISSSVVPFSSCPQSLPASESFPMS